MGIDASPGDEVAAQFGDPQSATGAAMIGSLDDYLYIVAPWRR